MPTYPSSLGAWRDMDVEGPARAAWEQFEPFFEQHGYKLFVHDTVERSAVPGRMNELVPAGDWSAIRCENEYDHFAPECLQMKPKRSIFFLQTGIHVAARSPRNTDVVIRIMAIGDEGKEHLDIMRALSRPDARVPENHTVPMVAELQKDDVIFGIFPMMWPPSMETPWFKTVREVLEALEQVLEGFTYLHQQLIAHRDFSLCEVFMNYGRDWEFRSWGGGCVRIPDEFRSLCPGLRYLINDFELSVQFAPESDPKTRLVTGIPTARYGDTAEIYNKPLPPEALLETPYCPFKMDIYQFGKHAQDVFENVDNVAGLQELFVAMASDNPEDRPTASEALAGLRAIRQTASEDALNAIPTDQIRWFRTVVPGRTCDCQVCTNRNIPGTRHGIIQAFPVEIIVV